MPTVGAFVDDIMYAKYKKVALENNLTISAVIKQALEKAEIIDVNKMKYLELERLAKLSWIESNLYQIVNYCDTKKVVDVLVLTSLLEIENVSKNF
jgi:hypothetical protein